MTFALARPGGPIHRVGRAPDAWAWLDWAYAPFGNRYDDPVGVYRVLYACEQRPGAFAETLARFRPDLELAAELALIAPDPQDEGATLPPGVVPSEWLDTREIGRALHPGTFVDIGHSDSLAHLRAALPARVLHYGFDDLDAGELRRRLPRAFTQEISRYVFERALDADGDPVAGIRYLSRLGDDFVNWAIFETEPPIDATSDRIDPDDPDLEAAFAVFGLTWG